MEAMMKKSICLALIILLAGCQSNPQSQARLKAKQFAKFPTAVEMKNQCESQTSSKTENKETLLWLCQFTSAIQYRFFDADLYRGKSCDLLVTQPLGQKPTGVVATGGDPKLCVAAIDAIKQAIDADTIPMRPANMPDTLPVRFKPQ